MPFGFGAMEIVIILLIATLIFGATRLPEIGAGLGTGIREFKDSLTGRNEEDEKASRRAELPK